MARTHTRCWWISGSKGLTGDVAEVRLEAVGLLVNRNVIPFDPATTRVTSGIRIGTPGVTVRGFGDAEMAIVAELIDRSLAGAADAPPDAGVLSAVADLCAAFPLTGRGLD